MGKNFSKFQVLQRKTKSTELIVLFNEDSKNINFFPGQALISDKELPEKLREMDSNKDICMQSVRGQF